MRAIAKKSVSSRTADSAETQLTGFVEKFDAEHQTLIRSVRKALRKRLPAAHELVYDNYNFFVIGYSPTERASDAILSIAAGANGVGLCFIHGAKLKDPDKLLLGAGKQTRFIGVENARVLDRPAVNALIDAAVARSAAPMPVKGRGTLVIKSVSAKQRPRRRSAATR